MTLGGSSVSSFFNADLVSFFLVAWLGGALYGLSSQLVCMILGHPTVKTIPETTTASSSQATTTTTNSSTTITATTTAATTTTTKRKRKVAIVTGSNTGVGYETARSLVLHHHVDVILACRSRDKAVQAVQQINAEVEAEAKTNKIKDHHKFDAAMTVAHARFLHPLDLSSLTSVRDFAQIVHDQYDTIDMLINNAGVSNSLHGPSTKAENSSKDDVLEIIFQTNFVSHFLLTNLLLDLFPTDGSGRIVNVSSFLHHFARNGRHATFDESYWNEQVHWDYYYGSNSQRTPYSWLMPTTVRATTIDLLNCYPASKLAAILFSMELNRRYQKTKKITSIAVNPGGV